jgi:N-acetylglucosaminyl-diphospho-decaprenol L-rhamnosyltransferase
MQAWMGAGTAAAVDVVVVSYNSGDELRGCVEGLAASPAITVTVVDNDSTDGCLRSLAGLPLDTVEQGANLGFAHGCNTGWRRGSAPYVLFLNPDARIDEPSVRVLAGVLDRDAAVGAVAPRIHDADGSLDFSQRRFPRLRSTFARALFLHRLFPGASWTDELVRTRASYDVPGRPDWVSGAAVLVRRAVLETLDGLDERFFMYCEDIDLCRRITETGWELAYEPGATVVHVGGASAPRTGLVPVLAASRIRYAAKHEPRPRAALERIGVALEAITHLVVCRGGRAARRGHARALRVAFEPSDSALAERLGAPAPTAADAGRKAVVGAAALD